MLKANDANSVKSTHLQELAKTRPHRTYKGSDKNTVFDAQGRYDDLGDERPRARLSFYGGSTPDGPTIDRTTDHRQRN